MATYVLVHGGWHGGWCWRKLGPFLRDAGHEVSTPTLTGLGERAHLARPEVRLTTHTEDVVQVLAYEDLHGVVLVGHSYGGMVITAVADSAPERVARLVYLDAFVPDHGQALVDLLPAARRDALLEQARSAGEGWRVPAPPPELYGVTDEADLAWVRPRLGPQPLATFTEPLRLDHPGASPPRTYIACTASATAATFRPFAERTRADSTWHYHELATGHDAMVTMPRELALLLLDIAWRLSPSGSRRPCRRGPTRRTVANLAARPRCAARSAVPHWVGSRFTSGQLVGENVVAFASGGLAYTVGFERGEVSVDSGERQPMTIRVTHIYRQIDGAWRLVHRHADFPPADQRQGAR